MLRTPLTDVVACSNRWYYTAEILILGFSAAMARREVIVPMFPAYNAAPMLSAS